MKRRWQQAPLSLLTLLAFVESCSIDGDDVRRHAAEWKARKIDDYVFVLFEGCFCEFQDLGGIRTVVRDNIARFAFGVETGLPFPEHAVTIDDVFLRAAAAADDDPDEFEVKYDRDDGFITWMQVDPDTDGEDDGLVLQTRCFSKEVETGCPVTTRTLEECEEAGGKPAEVNRETPSQTCGTDYPGAIGQILDSSQVCCSNQI